MDGTPGHCNKCLGIRNHEVLHSDKSYWSDEDMGYDGSDIYELLKCLGCGNVTLRHTSYFSEDINEYDGSPEPTIAYYPPAMSRAKRSWFHEMRSIDELAFARILLEEVYSSLQGNLLHVATLGIRALLESIMVTEVGDQGTFAAHLDSLRSNGIISDKQQDVLAKVLDAGSATTHRLHSPSNQDVITCLDIAESVIETIYIHPRRADELASRTPRRK